MAKKTKKVKIYFFVFYRNCGVINRNRKKQGNPTKMVNPDLSFLSRLIAAADSICGFAPPHVVPACRINVTSIIGPHCR